MILRRTIIVITIVIMTTVISAGLLILGNSKRKNNNVDIYSDSVNEIENVELSNEESIYNNSKKNSTESEDKIIEQPKSNEFSNKNSNITKEQPNNTSNNVKINNSPIIANDNTNTNNNETNNTNKSKDIEKATENVVEKKEDVYTFSINNSEIQNMISIAIRLIRENKDNRYEGLVDCVDNINFVIEKSGNVFYPLYEYRIANIVMDNYYPEFYVYAENIYKNGEYLRTEYYFQ